MKNQTLYIDRFSSISSLVVTSELQFLRLTPERSNLRLCGVFDTAERDIYAIGIAESHSEREGQTQRNRLTWKETPRSELEATRVWTTHLD